MGATYGAGTPLTPNAANIFKGRDRTNGFLMRNVDGRVPASTDGFSRAYIGAGNVLYTDGAIPFGNALFRDTGAIDTKPGAVYADKPTKSQFAGVLKFEQGWQTGHPVQNWGIPTYSRGTLVRKGPVGYKQTMTAVGQEANYLALLKGDSTKDTGTVRKVYSDWVALLKAGADGDRLAIFYGTASGFPIMSLVAAANLGEPTLADAVFGGWVENFEKENEAVFISLREYQPGVPAITT